MNDLFDALLFDAVVVTASAVALLTCPGARLAHPGVIYLGIHAYVVSFRGWAIYGGATTFMGVSPEPVAKAVVMADVFLVTATATWLALARRPESEPTHAPAAAHHDSEAVKVAVVAIPVGLLSLLSVGYVPGLGQGTTVVTSSYQLVALLWPALALVALIYGRGFSPALVVPLVVYLSIMGLQGYGRFRVVIPLIVLALIYLDRKDRRWPPFRILAAGLVAFAVFIPLKDIGVAVKTGRADLSGVISTVAESSRQAVEGSNREQGLLDQAAITRQLTDESEHVFYGRPYLALLTLPVPRVWWPEKPGLADHLDEISTPSFPLSTVGAVTGLPGDLYLNFRWPGVMVGAVLLAAASGTLFRRAYRSPRESVIRFLYLLFAAVLVQVARDGLVSLVTFTLVNATPWLAVAFLSRMKDRRLHRLEVQARRTGL